MFASRRLKVLCGHLEELEESSAACCAPQPNCTAASIIDIDNQKPLRIKKPAENTNESPRGGGHDRQKSLISRLHKVAPGGSLGGFPINTIGDVIITRGRGGRVWDADGKEYVDLLMGSGACFLGHTHPGIVAAVTEQAAKGSNYMAPSVPGIQLAEAICDAVPCAEQVRFCSEGSVANQLAVRLARCFTGKTKVLKFEGGYHGTGDFALMSTAPQGAANFPHPEPDSAGTEQSTKDTTLVAPYNDIAFVRSLLAKQAADIACIIVEPLQRVIPAIPGFLEELRAETSKHGILLIFDEVVTGFRFAYGGAQELYHVTPDLCTLGKAVSGGYPLAAVAGKYSIMQHFDAAAVGRENALFCINTLNGNPIAAAAGVAALKALREPGVYEHAYANGNRLLNALRSNMARVNIEAEVVGHPLMFEVLFTSGPIINYRDVQRSDMKIQARFNQLMQERGVLKAPSKFYVSVALTEADVAHVEAAFAATADVLQLEFGTKEY